MTRALSILALALLCGGCAATTGGSGLGAGDAASPSVALPKYAVAATADSFTLAFTLPTRGSWGCAPQERDTLHERQAWRVYRLNETTPPGYYHGCEADTACWRVVVAWNEPRMVASGTGAPGDSVRVRVAAGQYIARASNSKGESPCFGTIKVAR